MLCSRIHIKLLSFCCNVVFSVLHLATWDSEDGSNRGAYLSLLLRVSAGFLKQGLVFYPKPGAELFLPSNVNKSSEAIYRS